MMIFIKRERLYVLMLLFILFINLFGFFNSDKALQDKEGINAKEVFSDVDFKEEKIKEFLGSGSIIAKFYRVLFFIGFFIFVGAVIANIIFILRGERIRIASFTNNILISWSILDIFRSAISIVTLGYAVIFIQDILFRIFDLKIDMNLRSMLDTFSIDVIGIIVVSYFVVSKYKDKLKDLGLTFDNFLKNVASGIGSYIFILPALTVVLFLSISFLNLLGYEPKPQAVFEIFMGEERSRVLFFFTIFISLLGPIAEEIFFRGFMYPAIKKRFGIIWGALFSASIFSLLHTNIVGFLPIMALGLLLTYLYESTGSLTAPMIAHMLHNSIMLTLMFFVKRLV
ncbi:MAG: type II CAAX endopeptidase family protein [Candidatus Omnitrophota bacterium]